MGKKMLWAIPLVMALVLSGLNAYSYASETHMPFIARDNERGAVEAFWEVYNLPKTSIARIAFFTETEKILGITEKEARRLVEEGNVSTVPCSVFNLETASLLQGRVDWWRDVHKTEPVAYVTWKGVCVPWFLPACGNPVRRKIPPRPPAPIPPPADEMTTMIVNVGPCGCIQSRPTQITHYGGDSVYTRIGHVTIENVSEDVGMFMPTDCFSGNVIEIQVKKQGGKNNEK